MMKTAKMTALATINKIAMHMRMNIEKAYAANAVNSSTNAPDRRFAALAMEMI